MEPKKDQQIREEVEKTMRMLDRIERAKTDPYFFSRLKAKINSREEETFSPGLFPRPSIGIAVLMLLVILNIVTVFHYGNEFANTNTDSQEEIEVLVGEYELEAPIVYELETNEQ